MNELNLNGKLKSFVIASLLALVFVFIFGLLWLFFLAPARPEGLGWFFFAFATGLSMIVLPCTLPLAFVIVPMSMGKGFGKGIITALSFGAGVALTLSFYGIAAATLGGIAISELNTPLETIKNYVYALAGIIVYIFALSEIGLLKFRMPSYTGSAPAFIQKQGNFIKPFLLGMFLGNIGVGCPHPATPLLLIEIASSGDVLYGWLLFLVHAIGRVIPLLILATLAILGINGLNWLVTKKDKIEKGTGWAMVFVAGFIFTLGFFTHDWWVNSGTHTLLEKVTQEQQFLGIINAQLGTETTHEHGLQEGSSIFGFPLWLGNWVMVLLWIVPIWWWFFRERKRTDGLPEANSISEKEAEQKALKIRASFFVTLSLLLFILFTYTLPKWFFWEVSMGDHLAMMEDNHMTDNSMEGMNMESHEAVYYEEGDVTEGLQILLETDEEMKAGAAVKLRLYAKNLPNGEYADGLEIVHEKPLHLIGIRNDLGQFFHIHPKEIKPGIFEVEYTFEKPGVYKLYSDVSYKGVTYTFGHSQFKVKGDGEEFEGEIDISKNTIVGEYQVAARYPEILTAKDTNPVEFVVYDLYGNAVSLEPYLGEDMHLAVVSEDLLEYVHTHPENHKENMDMKDVETVDESKPHGHTLVPVAYAHGGVLDENKTAPQVVRFSVIFPKPGIYKMFAQFRPKGIESISEDQSLVASFYVDVFPHDHAVSDDSKILPPDPRFGDIHLEKSEENKSPVSKSGKLLVSIILIVLLSAGVKKYINQ